MVYYGVELWAEGGREWVPIKEFRKVPGQLAIVFDSSERLIIAEANARCNRLAAQHRLFTFRVAQYQL
jgi:hypothetical protein